MFPPDVVTPNKTILQVPFLMLGGPVGIPKRPCVQSWPDYPDIGALIQACFQQVSPEMAGDLTRGGKSEDTYPVFGRTKTLT